MTTDTQYTKAIINESYPVSRTLVTLPSYGYMNQEQVNEQVARMLWRLYPNTTVKYTGDHNSSCTGRECNSHPLFIAWHSDHGLAWAAEIHAAGASLCYRRAIVVKPITSCSPYTWMLGTLLFATPISEEMRSLTVADTATVRDSKLLVDRDVCRRLIELHVTDEQYLKLVDQWNEVAHEKSSN